MEDIKFQNSQFIKSTIREDTGVQGAILVDSILIRESELPYGDETNLIPKESIADEAFVRSLKGLLIFKEHPDVFVSSKNYSDLARESIGTIVDARYEEKNNDKQVVGTLRIVEKDAIDSISNKEIKGGSLGYYATSDNDCGKIVQKNLRPNHFCITYTPRDKGVQIFNSKKGVKMTEQEVLAIVENAIKAKSKDSENIVLSKGNFDSFMNSLCAKIVDKDVSEVVKSKSGAEKLSFLDNVMAVKDIFKDERRNSEDEKEENECDKEKELKEVLAENEALKKEIEELKSQQNCNNSDDEAEKVNSGESEDKEEPKEKEEANESDESQEKESSADEDKENESDEEDKKENSLTIVSGSSEVKNSQGSNMNEVLSQII